MRWRQRWPLLAVSVALFGGYLALTEQARSTESPRGFVAGLLAVCLGAWLYSVARGDDDRDDDEK